MMKKPSEPFSTHSWLFKTIKWDRIRTSLVWCSVCIKCSRMSVSLLAIHHPQDDGVRRWGPLGGDGPRGWGPSNRISALTRAAGESAPSLLPRADTMTSRPSATQKTVFSRTRLCWHPDLAHPASRTLRSSLLLPMNHLVCTFCYSSPNRPRHSHKTKPAPHFMRKQSRRGH